MIRRFMKRKPDDPGDSASLNDLSFILIIFFIAIAGFNVNKGFLMTLPNRERPRIVQTEDLLKCSIDASGTYSVDGKSMGKEGLEEAIKEKRLNHPNMTFLLLIDPETPYQAVVDVIQAVRAQKVENFSFRMEAAGA